MADEQLRADFIRYIKDNNITGLEGRRVVFQTGITKDLKEWGLCYSIGEVNKEIFEELLKSSWNIDIYFKRSGYTLFHEIVLAWRDSTLNLAKMKRLDEMAEILLEKEAALRKASPLLYEEQALLKNIGDDKGRLPCDWADAQYLPGVKERFEAVIEKVEKRHPGLTQTVLLDSPRKPSSTGSIYHRLRRGGGGCGDGGEVPLLERDIATKSPQKSIKKESGILLWISRVLSGKPGDRGPQQGLRP